MNIAAAFLAGILTFFTPCVFPLIPSYISFITGFSIEELSLGNNAALMKRAVIGSLMFILGFTIVFVLLGLSASFIGSFLIHFQTYLRIIGGFLIILFGFVLTGALNIGFLGSEKRMHLKSRPIGYLGSFIFGMTFAAGWVPCVGPLLSSILIIASTSGSQLYGGSLLFFYCLGLGLPVFISAVAFNYFLSFYKNIVKYLHILQIISGIILICIGALLVSDNLTLITSYLVNLFHYKEF